MSADISRLISSLRDKAESLIETMTEELHTQGGPSYAGLPRDRLLETLRQMITVFQESLDTDNAAPLVNHTRKVALQRATQGFSIDESMQVTDILRAQLWELMREVYAKGDWDFGVVERVERLLHEHRKTVSGSYGQTYKEAQDRLVEREQALEMQSRLIQELSTPIVPIYEGILVLPLVGAIDSRRATQVMEAVLEKIVEYQADVLILDITGVPVVDTGVANHLIQMARAVTLLGAQVIQVGISAEIAQTIVQLGVDMRNITTLANLQAGIAYALGQRGFKISSSNV